MLYPQESETRYKKELTGLWRFKIDPQEKGISDKWYISLKDPILMPVPASFNDVTQYREIRDYVGDVWYQKEFFVPPHWKTRRTYLYVGSATHSAQVWINNIDLGSHQGGFLPFSFELSENIQYGQANQLTILVNNELTWNTLPPGEVIQRNHNPNPNPFKKLEYHFDFFNYAGLHRPIYLLSLPNNFIDLITTFSHLKNGTSSLHYNITVCGELNTVSISLLDKDNHPVVQSDSIKNTLELDNASLWYPKNPYLYTLKVELFSKSGKLEDCYRLPIGIRTIKIKKNQFLINDEPFYFKGFGKHEDTNIRGRGFDQVIMIKDFNLMQWIGANSFRTSHYPYAEEVLNLADQTGIVVIDEVPAVGMNIWDQDVKIFCKDKINQESLNNHLRIINELIRRDINHPSVVMWSLANEAATFEKESRSYFKRLIKATREWDPSRPITVVQNVSPEQSQIADLLDVICVNHYIGWYTHPGQLELIQPLLQQNLQKWHNLYEKPLLVSEFGTDTIAGFHSTPSVMFTEEYQKKFLKMYFQVFDKLDFVIGEHIWNFADFQTKQGITRVKGNKKGIFTREREPKSAAFLVKERWTQ